MTTMTMTEPAARRRWAVLTSIRTRIVLGYVGLLLAALSIAVLVTRQVLIGRLASDIDAALVQEVEELRQLTQGSDPATGEPFGDDARALFRTFLNRNVPSDHEAFFSLVDGAPFLASYDAPFFAADAPALFALWATTTEPTWGTVDTPAGPARYLAVPLTLDGDQGGAAGVFVATHFPEADRAEIGQVIRIIVVASAVVLIVSAGVAWSLAARVLRPVRTLTRAARRVSETDLSHRIPVEGDDELAELSTTFNAMLDRLEEGFAGQRQFLDDVAHELRTPITIVSGHLELLDDDTLLTDHDERAETIALITDELARMNRYVNDLLLLAKAEQGDLLRYAPFDLGEFADQLLAKLTALAARTWTIDTAPRPGTVAVVADEERLIQAMLNLATNAVQHTADGDEIAIGAQLLDAISAPDGRVPGSTAGSPSMVRLWVRDNGPGIDAQHAEQLFSRRVRGAASRASRADGMGIGLSIVDAIARGHGGAAEAANVPAGGAQFTITVPADAEA